LKANLQISLGTVLIVFFAHEHGSHAYDPDILRNYKNNQHFKEFKLLGGYQQF
jgi:hypothetical protein